MDDLLLAFNSFKPPYPIIYPGRPRSGEVSFDPIKSYVLHEVGTVRSRLCVIEKPMSMKRGLNLCEREQYSYRRASVEKLETGMDLPMQPISVVCRGDNGGKSVP